MSKKKTEEDILEEMYRIYTVIWLLENIVFCENCRYASHPNDKPKLWKCSNSNWYMTDSDFCSRGIKREAE